MYSEALSEHVNRPKWQNWLGVLSIFLVWGVVIKGAGEGYSDHPVTSMVVLGILNAAMIYILFLIESNDAAAKKVDRELGGRIVGLDYELDVLREKYVALQKEHTELLTQTSKP
jgi:hypothetical protein